MMADYSIDKLIMITTKEDWQKWYAHKSNKEIWIEEQELLEEE